MNEEQYGGGMQAAPVAHKGRHWGMVAAVGAVLLVVGGLVWMNMRPSSPAKGGVTLSVRPPATPVRVGEEFTVDVLADAAGYAMTAADLVVTFDARILQAVSIRPGELMPTELAKGSVEAGTATITVASGTTPASGGGVIARVTFRALASGGSDVVLADGTQAAAIGQQGNVVGHRVPARVVVN